MNEVAVVWALENTEMKRGLIAAVVTILVCFSDGRAQGKTDWAAVFKDILEPEAKQLAVDNAKNLCLVVAEVTKNDLGLQTGRVQTRTELKLRSAGMIPKDGFGQCLFVKVEIVGAAFKADIEFHRSAKWDLPDGTVWQQFVTVWSDRNFGTHGRDVNFILGILDTLLEEFLNSYLKANLVSAGR